MLIVAVIYLIIPLRDEIVKRTSDKLAVILHCRLAEGHAAVHAARSLFSALLLVELALKFLKVSYTCKWIADLIFNSLVF